jgi:hypothetical protein
MVPPILNSGDTWQFSVSCPIYPASAGWIASLVIVGPSTVQTFSGTTNANGSDFDFLIPLSVTALITPGPYTFRIRVARSGLQFTAEESRITVGNSFAAPYDGQSVAEKSLVLCQAAIDMVLSTGLQSASIPGNSFSNLSLSELLSAKKDLLGTIRGEANALRIAQGLGSGRQVHVRFTNG